MSKKSSGAKNFLLVGNAPYTNRGCEAIVRGTMAILRREFGEDINVTQVTFGDPEIVRAQRQNEIDPGVANYPLHPSRGSVGWFTKNLAKVTKISAMDQSGLGKGIRSADCALQVGGDNYTFDYGVPWQHMGIDDRIKASGIPLFLWGASVGPFESDPQHTKTMLEHLKKMDGLFIREPDSYEYMKAHMPQDRVWRIVDPAFVMEPVEPGQTRLGMQMPQNSIALNFSPLLAKYITGGNLDDLVKLCAQIVIEVAKTTGKTILLLSHVTSNHVVEDDAGVLSRVAEQVKSSGDYPVICLPSNISAAELKWIISKCELVAAARTHATIAGFSTATPTVSFAYSRKAIGLNKEIYGSLDYCIDPADMNPANVSSVISSALASSEAIRAGLMEKKKEFVEGAYLAGEILRRVIESR